MLLLLLLLHHVALQHNHRYQKYLRALERAHVGLRWNALTW